MVRAAVKRACAEFECIESPSYETWSRQADAALVTEGCLGEADIFATEHPQVPLIEIGSHGKQRDGDHGLDKQIDVESFLLRHVPDDRKRLAFQLFMNRVPYTSKLGYTITGTLKVTERTARLWISEVIATLKEKLIE